MASQEKIKRIVEAYRVMARLGYRPSAPSDGMGRITIPSRELDADMEGRDYAGRFLAEEDEGRYPAGCTDFRSLRAAIWTLEAFRLMNAGDMGDKTLVAELLRTAADEYEQEMGSS